VLAGLVFALGLWLRAGDGLDGPFLPFALAVAGLAAGSLPALAGWSWLAEREGRIWLWVALDAALVTAVVAASGGPRSLFTFLYVLAVMQTCLLLSRTGAVTFAGLCCVLYIGLVLGRTILPLATSAEPTETTALEVLTVFLNSGVLMVSALVAGSLAERYRTTRRALETQQRRLSDVQAFRDLIFESVGTGLVAVGADHRITAFNPAAETITGLPARAALGRRWETVFGTEVDLDRLRAALEAGEAGSPRHELTVVRSDGRRVPVGISFWLLRSGQGAAAGLIGVCQDLSAIKEMEERVRRADRLTALGRLSANIAHEIRNPLASISGAIETLARELPADATRSRLMEIVVSESERLNQLIAEFLDYARPAPPSPIPVDLAVVLEEVLTLLQHRPQAEGIKIVRQFGDGLVAAADPRPLRQALWNLCLNAVQAMPAGGELRVGARRVAGPGRGQIQLWVSDTGHGIAPDDLPHVFEPFFSTKPGGTGLGLAIVYRVVQDHGGQVEVRSEPGSGTTFTLALPGGPGPEVGRRPEAC
jgi:two-component system sensor histidine kinase PilS (NtrC family)